MITLAECGLFLGHISHAAYCYRCSVVCVGHNRELYKNNQTYQDAIWEVDSDGPKGPCAWIPQGKGADF